LRRRATALSRPASLRKATFRWGDVGIARHGREPKTRLLCACWLCCSAVRAGNDSVR
jgi:hypothetical protein